jgi:F-type H+-transporting ATPase subunit b
MELITPSLGLIFWMTLAFSLLWFILGKYAWPAIIKALKEREASIEQALHEADKAREEMKQLRIDNEALYKAGKEERDILMRDARKIADSLIADARDKAHHEYQSLMESARESIQNEKMAAIVDLKNQLAQLSVEIAEKILREKLDGSQKQNEYIKKLVDEAKFN